MYSLLHKQVTQVKTFRLLKHSHLYQNLSAGENNKIDQWVMTRALDAPGKEYTLFSMKWYDQGNAYYYYFIVIDMKQWVVFSE